MRGALETTVQDIHYTFRTLRKNPGFALVVVLTIALGLGASTAVFSVVSAVLLKPLPYPNADRIVLPWLVSPPGVQTGSEFFPWSPAQFRLVEGDAHPYQALGVFQNDSFNLSGSSEPVRLDGFRASAGFFPSLGVAPLFGRTFTHEEDQPGHEHVVVISHRLWSERFNNDSNILGRALNLNGVPYTVIGVMPAGFAFPRAEEMPVTFNFPAEPALWVPLALPAVAPRGPSELAMVARLKPGVTIAEGQVQMNLITRHAEQADPIWKGWFNIRVTPLDEQVAGGMRRPLLLLLSAVGIVLLVACSNVVNLLLARSVKRKREFTLRAAVGAGASRLVRQLMTESLVIALVGGAVGTLLANAGISFARTFGPASLPRLHEVSLDWRVLAFALVVCLAAGFIFGLLPAIAATRDNIIESLNEGGYRSSAGRAHSRARGTLLVAQVALALVLVISAGLLVRTFYQMLKVDPGFRPERVLTFELSLPPLKYPDRDRMTLLYNGVLAKLQSAPGVRSAGIAEVLPLGGEGESTVITIIDHPVVDERERPFANYTIVSPGYFSAVGASMLRGRGIEDTDTADKPSVTVINTAMARKYWPGEDPIGKRVGLGSPRYPGSTIVGIVADIKHNSVRENPDPEMYVPYTQKPWPSMATMRVAVRTDAEVSGFTGVIREAIRSVDPELPVAKVARLTTFVDNSLTEPRFSMLLLASFAALALLMATVGMYGVISYSVAQRTREIGVRMAFGAEPGGVLAMVIAEGARLAGLGIVLGLAGALAVTRTMKSFLFGVQATDPLTFVSVSLLLVGVALLACYIPARRATRVDPMIALRYE